MADLADWSAVVALHADGAAALHQEPCVVDFCGAAYESRVRCVFPHAACAVTLLDRVVRRADVIEVEAESFRLKEAKELSAARSKRRKTKKA